MQPSNRAELIEYCKRALGAPLLEINVSDEQCEDRLEDALQYWMEFNSEAVERCFLKYEITNEDVLNGYITLPESVVSVIRLIDMGVESFGPWSIRYQVTTEALKGGMSGQMGIGGDGIVNYYMIQSQLALLKGIFSGYGHNLTYTRYNNRLKFNTSIGQAGTIIVIECYMTADLDGESALYNDRGLKELTTLYIKKQWGANMMKFDGMTLPGGITMNGRQMYDDAVQDIQTLKETFASHYEKPADFFIG